MKPRVIIADTDENYVTPLQLKFAKEFHDDIDLEIITQREYFAGLFSRPQKAEILVVSDELYNSSLQRHNIAKIFVMQEQPSQETANELNVDRMFKYTNISTIFNEIIGKSVDVLNMERSEKNQSQIILVTSAAGGTGKTTLAMGIAANMAKNYKKVLYINASRLQSFQYLLENKAPISSAEVYVKLANSEKVMYEDIKHVIRREQFHYLPPFKAALMSLGIEYSVFYKIALSAKKSKEYDFIIIDADETFDEDKAMLLDNADKVIIVTRQGRVSVFATNILVSNINGINAEKYLFICNDFNREESNAVVSGEISSKFLISEYVNHFKNYEKMKPEQFAEASSIQRVTFQLM